MGKKEYIKIINKKIKFNKKAKNIITNQINYYYFCKENYKQVNHNYKVGDDVYLKAGTLLHGTYKNLSGLKEIVNDGLISNWFINGRLSKYPGCVGVWNLKKDYSLKEYINFYSGGTIEYYNMNNENLEKETEVIPYNEMDNLTQRIIKKGYLKWFMEQTKEARFLPSLIQTEVQIGIIFNSDNIYIKKLLTGDILNDSIDNDTIKPFVNPSYYSKFIKEKLNKNDFFTDRESAILFGIPSCFIEGILVGKDYEKDNEKLKEIKTLLPKCYICNLDGKVIIE